MPALPVAAQSSGLVVYGKLLDAGTRQPIPFGAIDLLTIGGKRIETFITDSLGNYRFQPPEPGEYRLRAEHIGYRVATSPSFKVITGDRLHIDFSLSTSAVLMAPIEVRATSRPWVDRYRPAGLDPFYERMYWYKALGGLFYQRKDLSELEGLPLSSALAIMGRGRTNGRNVSLRQDCSPQYYLNGAPFPLDRGETIDMVFSPADLEAVEIYRGPSELPGEFAGTRGRCAIVLWTRRSN
jgi:hypothetical protein